MIVIDAALQGRLFALHNAAHGIGDLTIDGEGRKKRYFSLSIVPRAAHHGFSTPVKGITVLKIGSIHARGGCTAKAVQLRIRAGITPHFDTLLAPKWIIDLYPSLASILSGVESG